MPACLCLQGGVIDLMNILCASLKGGSGKSTLAFNLAVWLCHKDIKCHVQDLDPQATLSSVMSLRRRESLGPVPNQLPSSGPIGQAQGLTVIDASAGDPWCFAKAIKMADLIIMPVCPSQADVWSTQRFIRQISGIRGDLAIDCMAFINRADTHPGMSETAETEAVLLKMEGICYTGKRLGMRAAFRRAFSEGVSVNELDPGSQAAIEFDALATQIHETIHHTLQRGS